MINNQFKNQIFDIYETVHQYVYRTLATTDSNTYNWVPANTKGRSISSYFRHIANTEIYWLHALKSHDIAYITKNDSFDAIMTKYKSMEQVYNQLLNDANERDLEIRETKYIDNETGVNMEIIQRGTLAWSVLRICLHTLWHMSQITYILYALGVRGKEDPEYNWWNLTEKIISLGNLAKI